jgi:outer membrane protein OmpA-like peptidoglycan-associated protein
MIRSIQKVLFFHKTTTIMKIELLVISYIITLLTGSYNLKAQTKKPINKTQKGVIVGAGSGAVIGGIIGSKSKNTALGAILGATVGGSIGAIIGNKMDKQAKKLEDELGKAAKIERVGEGIKVTFDNKLLFDFGKATLSDLNKDALKKFANTLNQYPDTELIVMGHTDSKGSDGFNQALSNKRAIAVSNHLDAIGVAKSRLVAKGKGESQPIVSNNSEYNRSLNRRVEIAIFANEKMKADAKAEAGN